MVDWGAVVWAGAVLCVCVGAAAVDDVPELVDVEVDVEDEVSGFFLTGTFSAGRAEAVATPLLTVAAFASMTSAGLGSGALAARPASPRHRRPWRCRT